MIETPAAGSGDATPGGRGVIGRAELRDPGNRRVLTLAAACLPLVLFLVVGVFAHVPYVSEGPGLTVNTLGVLGADDGGDGGDVVVVMGTDVDPTSGNLNLTTVSVTYPLTLFEALARWASGRAQLIPGEVYFPAGKTPQQVSDDSKMQIVDSKELAIAVGLRTAGVPMASSVAAVAADGPSAGVLRTGDRIIAIDGAEVTERDTAPSLVRKRKPGEVATVTVERDGKRSDERVTLAAADADGTVVPVLGVTVTQVPRDPKVKVEISTGRIGGPSAGLMFALAIVDKLTPGELTGGAFIAGTGTIALDGSVGRIGGITHKMRAAREAGATVFLVPAGNCAEAVTDVPGGLRLVRVDAITDAIASLDALRTGADAPGC